MTRALAIILACLAALSAPAAFAQTQDGAALASGEAARIDAVFADVAERMGPGYALGLYRDGAPLYLQGYGYANLEDGVKITPDSVFHIASLSKQFTAAAVARLILEGRLSLTDPVAGFAPAFAFAEGLELRHLIYMTSGLPEYFALERGSGQPWFSWFYFDVDEALESVADAERVEFAPGGEWSYSNTNYMLLSRIVETVSGQPFGEYVEQNLFAPLGMDSSWLGDDSTRVIPDRARAYTARDEQIRGELASVGVSIRPDGNWIGIARVSPHYGGSGVLTSVRDFAAWDAAFAPGGAFGPDFAELMYRTERFGHDKTNDGFGLYFTEIGGRRAAAYDGADLDASSYMARFLESGVTVLVLSNDPRGAASDRAMQVIDILADTGFLD